MLSLREQLAAIQHAIWNHWMKYMFSCGTFNSDGSWTMPADKVERWSRQMNTDYSGLTDKERESDRHQADKVLASLRPMLQHRFDQYAKDADKYAETQAEFSNTSFDMAAAIYAFAGELDIRLDIKETPDAD